MRKRLQPGNGKCMAFIPKDVCVRVYYFHVAASKILEDILGSEGW